MDNTTVTFSIIVPVRKINDYMRENISHLKKLTYSNFEVLILVDFEETYDFEGDSRFQIIMVPGQKGPGEKRNVGAEKSSGDILVFLDDDAYPSESWLNHALEIFEDPGLFALGAPAMTPPNATFKERLGGLVLQSPLTSAGTIFRHIPSESREIDDYPTVNLFVRREAFFKVGGFDIEFWPGEDTKLCLDLVQAYGRKFLYDPRPIVYHHRRDLFRPHLKQISRYGRYRGQFARIFPETSRLPSYFVPSAFVLGLVLGLMVCYKFPVLWPVYFGVVGIYSLLLMFEATRLNLNKFSPKAFFYVFFGILFTHLIYGINFMIGFLKRPRLKLKKINTATGNYSEG